MRRISACLTTVFTLAASAGTSRADLDKGLVERARQGVAQLKPTGGTDVDFTALVTVKPEDLGSILRHGLINLRLVLRPDAFTTASAPRSFRAS